MRKGRGFVGMVMKIGKCMVIVDVDIVLFLEEKVKFLIIFSELLIVVVVVFLWLENLMYGVLLLG